MTVDDFHFFEGSATEGADRPRITVRRGGVLVLTPAAVALLGDGAARVQVGYNPKTRAVGIRAVDDEASGAYRLREQRNSDAKLVDGKRVFAHHGLVAEKARTYDAETFGKDIVGFVFPEAGTEPEPAPAAPKRKAAAKK